MKNKNGEKEIRPKDKFSHYWRDYSLRRGGYICSFYR
jgi:hypothetical protein